MRSRYLPIVLLLIFNIPKTCFGWGYQGHIIITRLAALRIIQDPTAPQGLRDFLKTNMPHSMDDCQALALHQTLGLDVADEFDQGLDHACILPDQLRFRPEGKIKIEPYGAPESLMHYLDLEAFSPDFAYKDDLSSKPDVNKIPHDLSDPRWKRAGYVPWRVEEMYRRLIDALGPGNSPAHAKEALRSAGFLAHYVEDSTNPHHATMDFKSFTYLAGHIPQLPALQHSDSLALAAIHLPRSIDPHGDFEFQLFENDQPPRDQFRAEYWRDLNADIAELAAHRAPPPANFDPFRWDLHILADSYDDLPLIGLAARAAYGSGSFDPQVFFSFKAPLNGKEMSIVQLIAQQNAKAVLDTEEIFRLAWATAHTTH